MKKVFFYGLFMDESLLAQKGIVPSSIQKGWVDDHELIISARASLVPAYGIQSYGMVMSLRVEDIDLLYSDPSVQDYRPEKLPVFYEDGSSEQVVCYNLPKDLLVGANREYAAKLLELCHRLSLPKGYLAHIRSFT